MIYIYKLYTNDFIHIAHLYRFYVLKLVYKYNISVYTVVFLFNVYNSYNLLFIYCMILTSVMTEL